MAGFFGGSGNALTSAKQSIANIQRGRDQFRKNVAEGSANLQNYTGQANNTLENYNTKGIDQLKDWGNEARQALIGGMSYLDQGVGQAAPYYQQVADLYGGLAPGDLSARAMYLNSLGLNGAEGNTAATNAFQVSPGYQFQVDEANKNILRNAAATGNVLSGNAGIALNDRAQQLANQEYGNWQNRLSSQGNNIYNDYSGQAGALGNLASLFANLGSGKAQLSQNIANIDTGIGSGVNNAYQGLGTNTANNLINLGTGLNQNNLALAQNDYNRAANINNAQQQAAANSQAQQQAWLNALGQVGGSIFSAAGNAGGFSSLFG